MFTNKNYVLTVYREGSFSNAAKKLYISQPSLSASIKRIEEKIGVPIFDRSTTPVSLTEVGEEYVKYALFVEEKEQDFARYISDYANFLTGSVRIGGSSLFSSFMLPGMISDFNKKYPNIKFEIFEDNTKTLLEKLNLGTLDLIIDNAYIDDDAFDTTVCTSETLLLAVPKSFAVNDSLKNYRLTSCDIKSGVHYDASRSVSLKKFSNYPFILLHPENDTGKRAAQLFKKYHISPQVTFYLDQQVTAYNVSSTGMGISFVSDILIRNMETGTSLFYYRLNDKEIERNIYFYKKNAHYLSNACQKFIETNSEN
ncbi:MAG: LysR family transcriptional regulator [Ruminococcaceae bacterium]|nr:LysR family transcriptional regulator [Oscillospiraceae bacterium]